MPIQGTTTAATSTTTATPASPASNASRPATKPMTQTAATRPGIRRCAARGRTGASNMGALYPVIAGIKPARRHLRMARNEWDLARTLVQQHYSRLDVSAGPGPGMPRR